MTEYLRLAFGTVLVLLPGLALGRTMSEAVAWAMGALFVAWAVVFTVHSNIEGAALVLLLLFVAALAVRRQVPGRRRLQWRVRTLARCASVRKTQGRCWRTWGSSSSSAAGAAE